jgi:hypothetical protein
LTLATVVVHEEIAGSRWRSVSANPLFAGDRQGGLINSV